MPGNPPDTASRFSRRRLLTTAGAAGLAALGARPGSAWAALLRPTAGQTAGPFYVPLKPLSVDNDLVRIKGRTVDATGRILHLTGQVLDPDGKPVKGARVEIWQANSKGDYHHPGSANPSDPNFQGIGHDATDAAGGYRFRTIKPPPYGSILWARTPHIHFAVFVPGQERWTTQMYFEGEDLNERDSIFQRLAAADRPGVVRPIRPAGADLEPGAGRVDFDIVVGRV